MESPMLLRPGTTVLARSLSHGTEIEAVLEGRNGCRPEQWLARWKDHRGEHLAIIDPGNLLAVWTENGFQRVMPGVE